MNKENKDREKGKKEPLASPDPETLHTTDPQEHMRGPVSSTMHGTGHAFESNESKEEATRKKDRNT